MTILFVSLAIIYAVLAWRKPDWALFVLLAGLPSYLFRANLFGLPLTFLETMILLSFAIWFFRNIWPQWSVILKNHRRRAAYPYSAEIILLLIISLASLAIAGFSQSSLGIWKAYFFEPILLYILIFNFFSNQAGRAKILWALLISSAAVSAFAIFQEITGLFIANPFWTASATRRSVSFFGYPNAVGLYLAPLVMIFFGWLLSLSWKKYSDAYLQKIIIILVIAASVLAIYFARSEGALAGLVAGVIIMALASGRRARFGLLIGAILLSAGLALSMSTRSYLVDKLTLHDLSGEIRQQQWKETWTMLKDNNRWLTGTGLDNYQTAIKPYHQEGIFYNSDRIANFDAVTWASSTLQKKYWQPVEIYKYPHNIFLNFWSELGIAGLLLFVWLIGKYLFIGLKLSRRLGSDQTINGANEKGEKYFALSLATAMVAVLVHGLVDVPYFKNDLSVLFWIMIALGGLTDLNHRREIIKNKALRS